LDSIRLQGRTGVGCKKKKKNEERSGSGRRKARTQTMLEERSWGKKKLEKKKPRRWYKKGPRRKLCTENITGPGKEKLDPIVMTGAKMWMGGAKEKINQKNSQVETGKQKKHEGKKGKTRGRGTPKKMGSHYFEGKKEDEGGQKSASRSSGQKKTRKKKVGELIVKQIERVLESEKFQSAQNRFANQGHQTKTLKRRNH